MNDTSPKSVTPPATREISQPALAINYKWLSDVLQSRLMMVTDELLAHQEMVKQLTSELEHAKSQIPAGKDVK